jgi:signal peptidase II
MLVSVIIYAVVFFDQLTKWWADRILQHNGEIELIKDALYFKYATNDGMAFGLLGSHRWIFLSLTLIVLLGIFTFYLLTLNKKKLPLLNVALGLVAGGGIGNMIDRIFFADTLFAGKVIDFIDFRLINFAIFNLADSAVCIGEALLILYILFVDRIEKKYIDNSDVFTLNTLFDKDVKK